VAPTYCRQTKTQTTKGYKQKNGIEERRGKGEPARGMNEEREVKRSRLDLDETVEEESGGAEKKVAERAAGRNRVPKRRAGLRPIESDSDEAGEEGKKENLQGDPGEEAWEVEFESLMGGKTRKQKGKRLRGQAKGKGMGTRGGTKGIREGKGSQERVPGVLKRKRYDRCVIPRSPFSTDSFFSQPLRPLVGSD
jgi:hypothetical protein